MRTCRGLRRVVLATAALLCLLAGEAQATHGEISTWGEIDYSTVWAPLEITTAEMTVRCGVTLEGSFSSSTYVKTVGTHVGEIVEARFGRCTGGSARVLSETLPWAISYASFSGTLPSITGITVTITGMAIGAMVTGLEVMCLARSEARNPARGIGVVGREISRAWEIPRIRADETARIPVTGGGLCAFAGSAVLRGTGTNLPGTAEGFLVNLI